MTTFLKFVAAIAAILPSLLQALEAIFDGTPGATLADMRAKLQKNKLPL